MRGHARRRIIPSVRPPTVNPPRRWFTSIGPPNSSKAYSGTFGTGRGSALYTGSTMRGMADLGDVAQEHFGGLDAPEAHYDTGAPTRLGKLYACGVHPHPCAAHVCRPPFVCPRVPLYCAGRHACVLDRSLRQRYARDARVQSREHESLE